MDVKIQVNLSVNQEFLYKKNDFVIMKYISANA